MYLRFGISVSRCMEIRPWISSLRIGRHYGTPLCRPWGLRAPSSRTGDNVRCTSTLVCRAWEGRISISGSRVSPCSGERLVWVSPVLDICGYMYPTTLFSFDLIFWFYLRSTDTCFCFLRAIVGGRLAWINNTRVGGFEWSIVLYQTVMSENSAKGTFPDTLVYNIRCRNTALWLV